MCVFNEGDATTIFSRRGPRNGARVGLRVRTRPCVIDPAVGYIQFDACALPPHLPCGCGATVDSGILVSDQPES